MNRTCMLKSALRPVAVAFLLFTANGTIWAKAVTPLFMPAMTHTSGGDGAMSVAVADVNGDAKPDVVVINACPITGCSDHEVVAVLLANGDGTFRDAVTYGSGGAWNSTAGGDSGMASVAIADVNKDTKPDVVVTNPCGTGGECTSGSVGVLLGNGDGTFQSAVTYGSGGYLDTSVAVADLDQDGDPDLVVSNQCATKLCDGDGLVGVLFGKGDGTFRPVTVYDAGGRYAQSVAVGDVNRDGRLEIVVPSESDSVAELLGNGDGTFQPPVTFEVPGFHRLTVIADVNVDHNPDLVLPNYSSHSVDVLLGNGAGAFGAPMSFDTGGLSVPAVALADVNGDGALDVLAVNSCADFNCLTGTVAVLMGNADGTFQPPVTYDSAGYFPGAIAVGDVNGDAKPDVLVANFKRDALPLTGGGSVGVLLNDSPEPILAGLDIKPGEFPNRVNPHSHALLRVALLATDTLDVKTVDAASVRFGPAGARPFAVRGSDVNGDGRVDAVYYFKMNLTGIACGDTSAGLVGVDGDGQTFAGTDSIQTEGCRNATGSVQ